MRVRERSVTYTLVIKNNRPFITTPLLSSKGLGVTFSRENSADNIM